MGPMNIRAIRSIRTLRNIRGLRIIRIRSIRGLIKLRKKGKHLLPSSEGIGKLKLLFLKLYGPELVKAGSTSPNTFSSEFSHDLSIDGFTGSV